MNAAAIPESEFATLDDLILAWRNDQLAKTRDLRDSWMARQ